MINHGTPLSDYRVTIKDGVLRLPSIGSTKERASICSECEHKVIKLNNAFCGIVLKMGSCVCAGALVTNMIRIGRCPKGKFDGSK